jgi:hypothetical protein
VQNCSVAQAFLPSSLELGSKTTGMRGLSSARPFVTRHVSISPLALTGTTYSSAQHVAKVKDIGNHRDGSEGGKGKGRERELKQG